MVNDRSNEKAGQVVTGRPHQSETANVTTRVQSYSAKALMLLRRGFVKRGAADKGNYFMSTIRVPSHRLTPDEIIIIIERIRNHEFLNRIASDYDVNPGRISEIKKKFFKRK